MLSTASSWWLALLADPAKAFDWHDAHGAIDHGKVCADLVVFTVTVIDAIIALHRNEFLPVGHLITLIAGAMGSRVFVAFLRSHTVTAHEEVETLQGERPIYLPVTDPDAVE